MDEDTTYSNCMNSIKTTCVPIQILFFIKRVIKKIESNTGKTFFIFFAISGLTAPLINLF